MAYVTKYEGKSGRRYTGMYQVTGGKHGTYKSAGTYDSHERAYEAAEKEERRSRGFLDETKMEPLPGESLTTFLRRAVQYDGRTIGALADTSGLNPPSLGCWLTGMMPQSWGRLLPLLRSMGIEADPVMPLYQELRSRRFMNQGGARGYIAPGTRFGRLVTLDEPFKSEGPNRRVIVRCDCGTEFDVKCKSLKSGDTRSCGGHRSDSGAVRRRCVAETRVLKFEAGQRFGRLTVIDGTLVFDETRARNRFMVKVRCDCGAEKLVPGQNLWFRRTRSCGCLQRENQYARRSA